MEKLGLCCADMSINSAPEGRETRCLAEWRTMGTQLRMPVYMQAAAQTPPEEGINLEN